MGLIISTRQFGFLSGLFAGRIKDSGLDLKLRKSDKFHIIDATSNFKGVDKELNLDITVKLKPISIWKALLSYHFNIVSGTYSLLSCKIVIGDRLTIDEITSLNAKTKLLNLVDNSVIREIEDYLKNELPNKLPEELLQFIREHLNSYEGRYIRGRTSFMEDLSGSSRLNTPKSSPVNNGNVDDIQRFYDNAVNNSRYPIKSYKLGVSKFTRDELVIMLNIGLNWSELLPTYTINPQINQIKTIECSIKAGAEGDIVENITPQNWLKRLKEEGDSYETNENDEFTTIYQTLNGYDIGREDLRDMDKFFKQEYNKIIPTFLINTLKQYKQERGL